MTNVPFKIMQSRVYKIQVNVTVSRLKVGYALQMKLIPKLHSNILGILTSKRRGQKLLINAERTLYNGIFGFEQYQLARFHSGV